MEHAVAMGNFRQLSYLARGTGRKALFVSERTCEAEGSSILNQ